MKVQKIHKKRFIIARTVNFGINILDGKPPVYEPFTEPLSNDDVLELIGLLEEAYDKTELPDKPDAEPYREFLEKTRRKYDGVN